MSKHIFLDTSYVLSLVNANDEYHNTALELANNIEAPLITTEAVLTEIGNALSKSQWRELSVETLNDLRTDDEVEVVTVSSDLFSKAIELYSSRMDKEWGLTDCISFVVMKDRNLTDALTTDRHFEQTGFKALLRAV